MNREDFCEGIREVISQGLENSQELNPQARWEFLKLSIHEFSISFNKKLKEDHNCIQGILEPRLFELENKVHFLSDRDLQEEFHMIKRELLQIQLLQARESMIRAQVKWAGEGERPSKFFLNLEKKNYDSKSISEIYNGEGTIITDPEEILQFEKSHFSAQFEQVEHNLAPHQRELGESFLSPSDRSMTDLDRQVLDCDLSLEEMEEAICQMKNGKAPGCDGLPVEFYKKFWDNISPHLLASF